MPELKIPKPSHPQSRGAGLHREAQAVRRDNWAGKAWSIVFTALAVLLVPVPVGFPGFGWMMRPVGLWLMDAVASPGHVSGGVIGLVGALLLVPVAIICLICWRIIVSTSRIEGRAPRMAIRGMLLCVPVAISLAPLVGPGGGQKRSFWATIPYEEDRKKAGEEARKQWSDVYSSRREDEAKRLERAGKHEEAEGKFRELLVIRKRALAGIEVKGATRDGALSMVAETLKDLALIESARGSHAEAESRLREARSLLKEAAVSWLGS